jgi:hypothetical protein
MGELANQAFGGAVGVTVGGVDEVAATVDVGVEDGLGLVLKDAAQAAEEAERLAGRVAALEEEGAAAVARERKAVAREKSRADAAIKERDRVQGELACR